MSRAWKPGDVAMADGCRMMRTQSGWLYASPGSLVNYTHAEGSSADHVTALARPLVVIDPEDAEQVERLLLARWRASGFDTAESGPSSRVIDEWQAALREFADPKPRIEEPRGLGAVVADADGHKWTRANSQGEWFCECGDEVFTTWDEFTTATEVLSEGVTS